MNIEKMETRWGHFGRGLLGAVAMSVALAAGSVAQAQALPNGMTVEQALQMAAQMSPEQLAALVSKVPAAQRAALLKKLKPEQLAALKKRLSPQQLAALGLGGGAPGKAPARKLAGKPGEPVKMYINLKTMDIRVVTAQEEQAFQAALKQAAEAGQSPYFPGSQYLVGRMELVKVPAGSFFMGSNLSEPSRMADENRHEVQLTKEFWMGCFEVTQEQWRVVMGADDKSPFKQRPGEAEIPRLTRGNGYPMCMVTHEEAMQFCRKLTLAVRKRAASAQKGMYILPENLEFTLPTEAQWEYACRAGSQTPYSSGEILLARDAVYHVGKTKREVIETKKDNNQGGDMMGMEGEGNRQGQKATIRLVEEDYIPVMKPVGVGNPNAFGLYDMHGSVWEWCKGAYYKYPSTKVVDPQGPRNGFGVVRGGGWYSFAQDCRSARRMDIDRTTRQDNMGFRVVISVKRY